LIQSFNENLVLLTDSADLVIVDLWDGVTELFLSENIPIKEPLTGIFEFFAEHIPLYLHSYVLERLSSEARSCLFPVIVLLAI
jgi:hypothetical protein